MKTICLVPHQHSAGRYLPCSQTTELRDLFRENVDSPRWPQQGLVLTSCNEETKEWRECERASLRAINDKP